MKKIWCLLCICMLAAPAMAQVRVSKAANAKVSLDWSGFNAGSDGGELLAVLKNDLIQSGWFVHAAAGTAECKISGDVTRKGSQLVVRCRVQQVYGDKEYINKRFSAPAAGMRALAHEVADAIVLAVTGYKGIASTKIALVGNRTRHKEVYICDADGGNLIQLTSDQSISIGPQWGPEAEELVYTSYLKGFPDVYLVDIRSGKRDRVSSFGGLNTGADISPDGKELALILSRDGNPELYIMNLRTRALTRLTRTGRGSEASPTWSPDGNRIAYVSDTGGRPHLYVIDRRGGQPKRLTSRGRENVAPDWGPNGWIAYSSRIGGQYQVFAVNPDSGVLKQISQDGADYEDPSWAPDGRHIVCARVENYRSAVYILDTMGDRPIRLTNIRGDWFSPAWSPQ